MKKVLIISPYFPPCNAPDMQRVRMSLPYFAALGWHAEVVTVEEQYADIAKDVLLLKSVPAGIKVHNVKALHKKWTSKLGLGSIALRSLWFYRKKVNMLLKSGGYDLIYFSTTQFPVCVLGAYWKKRFDVPYIIDLQDPWHSDYYLDKPKAQRPKKYWLSYRLNKYLEPLAIKHADGLISVSESYIIDLKNRYPAIENLSSAIITFGAFDPDNDIAAHNEANFKSLLQPGFKNIVYAGRGGVDLHKAIIPVFEALKNGFLEKPVIFSRLKLYFIGTSYAPAGQGEPTIMPLAKQYGIENNVVEITDRISYYHTLTTLQQADALFIPGSDDPKYTASKLYPYLLSNKPLLAIFNRQSPALGVLKEYNARQAYAYDETNLTLNIRKFLDGILAGSLETPVYDSKAIEKYSAPNMASQQCLFFNRIIEAKH